MWICEYVKNRIDTSEKCFFRFEKGYKRINVQDKNILLLWCATEDIPKDVRSYGSLSQVLWRLDSTELK